MCGLAVCWSTSGADEAALTALTARLAGTLRHRGPDDGGVWVDADAGLGLGFRRLSIVDLSPLGHQPMVSASGRYVMAFNGEVYNFARLRPELERLGHAFRGHSDTEVMLAAFEEWGIGAALERFVGMFAIALWDRRERRLTLVRDRLGKKPLYYGWAGDAFLCGSELKALRAHAGFAPPIDRDALALYLRHGYIPAPYTIYEGVHKLPPGALLTLGAPESRPAPQPYWSMRAAVERGLAAPLRLTDVELIEELDALLRDAVGLRMIADVPLGAFLSGGIDSSTVVALMQAQSVRPVRTFSIGFAEDKYNEATHAAAVAAHLGTDHTELYVTPEEARAVIPRLPLMFDEPFADSSQIPTFLVAEMTRRHVTVALSGDGGDELFAGYPRYAATRAVVGKLAWFPRPLRRPLAGALLRAQPAAVDRWFGWLAPLTDRFGRRAGVGKQAHKLGAVLLAGAPELVYHRALSHWKEPAALVASAAEPPTPLTDAAAWLDDADFTTRMQYLDAITYLPDDILTKVDRASMAVSLEARVPLLDHRVVEFAWRVPLAARVRDGQAKWLLRQVLYRYVPPALVERPKMGFGVPIGEWLRGPLRDWAEALLDARAMAEQGFVDPRPVRDLWQAHLAREGDWEYMLWDVLMFQAWREAWAATPATILHDEGAPVA